MGYMLRWLLKPWWHAHAFCWVFKEQLFPASLGNRCKEHLFKQHFSRHPPVPPSLSLLFLRVFFLNIWQKALPFSIPFSASCGMSLWAFIPPLSSPDTHSYLHSESYKPHFMQWYCLMDFTAKQHLRLAPESLQVTSEMLAKSLPYLKIGAAN